MRIDWELHNLSRHTQRFSSTRCFSLIGLILMLGTICSHAAQLQSSSAKSQGAFSDFESLTGARAAAASAAASSNPTNAPIPANPTRNGAAFVSNVLALAATSTNTSPTASLNGYVPDDKYKLRVGDRLSFQITEDRDPAKPLTVADNGELDIPYIGRVYVVDKTCKQLTDELKQQLEKEYYYRATVILALDIANKVLGRIYVWGQVKNQGPLEIAMNENLTVGKAILRAGGFGDFANKKRVKIIRGSGADGRAKQSFELNMVEILEKGLTEKDVVLQPDDSIIVPTRLINF
jgi:polysaccharide export outer membrane protein